MAVVAGRVADKAEAAVRVVVTVADMAEVAVKGVGMVAVVTVGMETEATAVDLVTLGAVVDLMAATGETRSCGLCFVLT